MNDGWLYASACARSRLDELHERTLYRNLYPERFVGEAARAAGVIDLTTNDYLGLRHHAEFQQSLRESTAGLPASAGASRLLGGEHPIFAEVENAFSAWKGAEAALFFTSGFAANEALCSLLTMPEAAIFSDALNHASIIDGLRLARAKSITTIFAHNDMNDLRQKLRASTARVNFIYTESLFSMDGDFADLPALQTLCRDFRGVLILDEAHAVGTIGDDGQGLLRSLGFSHEQVLTMSTCGKALGVHGAFICGPQWVRELLVNHARSFIYSTGSSPWIAAAVGRALRFVAGAHQERRHLSNMAEVLRNALEAQGRDLGASESFIIPVILGDESAVLAAQDQLRDRGIFVAAIRPPTVPWGSARLRLSLTADLDEADVMRIAAGLAEVLR